MALGYGFVYLYGFAEEKFHFTILGDVMEKAIYLLKAAF